MGVRTDRTALNRRQKGAFTSQNVEVSKLAYSSSSARMFNFVKSMLTPLTDSALSMGTVVPTK